MKNIVFPFIVLLSAFLIACNGQKSKALFDLWYVDDHLYVDYNFDSHTPDHDSHDHHHRDFCDGNHRYEPTRFDLSTCKIDHPCHTLAELSNGEQVWMTVQLSGDHFSGTIAASYYYYGNRDWNGSYSRLNSNLTICSSNCVAYR